MALILVDTPSSQDWGSRGIHGFAAPPLSTQAEPQGRPGRSAAVDGLRGLLMVAVIVGHFPQNQYRVNAFGPAADWIYFIHVPLFLALSCLFTRPWSLAQLRLRAGQLLVPYLLWGCLSQPRLLLTRPGTLLARLAMGNWASLESILWFLPALFTLNVLAGLWRLERRGLRWALGAAAGAVFLLAPRLAPWHGRIPFGLDVALFLLPFTWAMDRVWGFRERLRGRGWTAVALLALPAGALLLRACEALKTHSPYARRVDLAQFSVPVTVPGYAAMTLMGAALLVLALRLGTPRWLAAVGRYSMPVFLLHYGLLYLLTRTIRWTGASYPLLLAYGVAAVALTILLAMAIARVLAGLSPRFAWLGMTGPRGDTIRVGD